ncbi:hypothetical protein AX16_005178 [Volvariella volvacea WC 439]|nr:hypothetical protein AX16_005178 [Volvariella volvacea WC 439]
MSSAPSNQNTELPSYHPLDSEPARTKTKMGLVGLTVDIPSSSRTQKSEGKRPPPRWRTLEFKIYYVIALVVIPLMAWIPITLSSTEHPNYPLYATRLSEGWLFGRMVDNSDAQYRSFRNNIPALALLILLHQFTKFMFTRATNASGNALSLIPFNLAFSILMLLGLHGTSIIKILLILTTNYVIGKACRGHMLGPILTWIFNAAVLFANDIFDGYRFGALMPALESLDSWQGIYPRWNLSFNITMLRLVSFNMDFYWACKAHGARDVNDRILTDKQRQAVWHPPEFYSYINYVSYAIYAPLYIAGPIMTFNDYIWQNRQPAGITRSSTFGYLIRFLVSLLTMEFILHFMYVVAIKDSKAWAGDTPAEISMIGFWNLIIVWLKLLIPWRFFRLWALTDGIDPPENMVRCMANNYSTLGFWRSWHRSYNLWIIRYIYVPLGGTHNVFLNSLLVFTFVALWHDLTFRLLAWGWLVTLFILPELLARYTLPSTKYGGESWYRHVCAIGAVFNILMMMAANLVGFVVGTDGLQFFLDRLFGTTEGLQFLVGAICCLFVGVQLMFEYREEEMRQGIFRRC